MVTVYWENGRGGGVFGRGETEEEARSSARDAWIKGFGPTGVDHERVVEDHEDRS
jgi:hypothetical protein